MIKKKYAFFFIVLLFTLLTGSIIYATDNTTDTTTEHVVNNADKTLTEPIHISEETQNTQQAIDKTVNNTNKEVNSKLDKTAKNIKTDDEIIVNDYEALKTGIDSLEEDDETTFILNPENTYTITSPISINKMVTITINGNGATIDGNGNQWMNGGDSDLLLTIANITVQNCKPYADGGVFSITSGELIIENSTFRDCSSPWQGGVINGGYTAVTFTNCTFENNQAGGNGGVIFVNNDVTVTNSKFIDNQANACGGSIRINGGYLSVENSVFKNNRATQHGGAIYSLTESTIKNTSFENNLAQDFYDCGGGAIYTANAETDIIDSEFINNRAENYGGAIYSDGDLTITNTSFKRNNAYKGGVIKQHKKNLSINSSSFDENYVNWGDGTGAAAVIFADADEGDDVSFTLNNSNFTNNYGEPGIRAGAIFIERINTTVNNSIFNNNTATSNYDSDNEYKYSDGGSIYASITNLTVNNTNFTNHEGTVNGAGIYLYGSNLTVDNSKFENISSTYGGAIYGNDFSSMSINNSKFRNTSVGTTGGSILSYGPLNVNNSEFRDNCAEYSGAIHSHGETTIDNSIFNNCTARSNGGAVSALDAQLTINHTNFTNNNETGVGAAIYTEVNTYIDNSLFINNTATRDGGAIEALKGSLTVNNSKFINNNGSDLGGAIYARCVTLIDNSDFINNTAFDGGSIQFGNETLEEDQLETLQLTVINSKFINNNATRGGVIYTFVNVSLENSEFTNNTADYGGVLYTEKLIKATVDHSNFINNTAISAGALSSSGELIVNNSNFTNHKSDYHAGVIYFSNGNLTIDRSVFINNTVSYKGAIASPYNANASLTNSNITIDQKYIDDDVVISHDATDYANITRDNNTINGVFVDEGYVLTHFIVDYPDYLIVGEESNISGKIYHYKYKYYRNDTVKVYIDDVEIDECQVDQQGKFNFTYTQTQATNTTIKLELISSDHYYTLISEEKELGFKYKAEVTISTDAEIYESTPITVTGTLTGIYGGIPDKQVKIYVNEELKGITEATDTEGKFTYTFTSNNPEAISIYAEFDDDNYIANKSNTINLINKVATTITLDEITQSNVNEEFTITGTLTYGDGVPVENQKVTITIGEQSFESGATDSEGKFTYTYMPVTPGILTVSAKFDANGYYLDSDVVSMDVIVASGTVLSVDEFDEGFYVKVDDDAVEINGTLVDANGNGVTGKEIKFTINEAVSGTVTTDSEGKFTYTFTPEDIGEKTIVAAFEGDEVYSSSNDNLILTVKVDTQLILDTITSPVNVGDKVTITGKLTDVQDNVLSGQNVSITIGEESYVVRTSDDGSFSYEYETTNVGVVSIAAIFEDNGFYLGSNSGQSQDVVVVSSTKLVVDEIVSPVTIGESVEITGKLTDVDDNAIAAQAITLYINGVAVNAEIITNNDGIFSYSYMTTDNGLNNVTASYAGQDYYLENNTSNLVEFTVKTPTTITVQPITTPVKVNDEITINVELKDSYNNMGLTGQNIIIKVDGEVISSEITDNDDGTYTTKYMITSAGEHTITAVFEETGNYFASEDATGQKINAFVDTTVVLNAIDTIAHTQVTITVTIVAADDSKVNDGQVTLTLEDGTIIATANVENSQATITYIFNEELDTTITATFNQSDKYADSSATNTVKVVELPVILTVDTTTFTIGQTTQLKATIYQGSDVVENINKGKVVFKVNGKTIKDENGKVIYAKVVNGVAIIDNFTVPDSWNQENMTISASYMGSNQLSAITSEKMNITIIQPQPTITTNDITATAGSTISLNATVKVGTEPVNIGKVVFKINGKTLKDENGKVIYAKVVDGIAVINNYTIPSSYKAKAYTLTATYISSDIKVEDIKTLNITA